VLTDESRSAEATTPAIERARDPSREPAAVLDEAEDGVALTAEDAAGRPIPIDVAFDIMKNRRRRRVLAFVLDRGGRTTLSELAEHIAALENDKPESLLSSQERKRVYIGLYQCHLPRMDDAGVIEFDRYRGTVEVRREALSLRAYVQVAEPLDEPRVAPATSQVLVVAGAAVFAVASLLPGMPEWLPGLVVVGLVLAVGLLSLGGLRRVPQAGATTEPPFLA